MGLGVLDQAGKGEGRCNRVGEACGAASPLATRCPVDVKACSRGPGWQRRVVAGLCWTSGLFFGGGPPVMRRSFYKPFAHQSLILIIASAELVGEEADGLLGELGEVEDAGDEQGSEQQRQYHAPRRGQGVVAPGLGAEAPSGFHVPGHFPVPCLQQPRDGAAAPGLLAAPSPCLLPAWLRGFGTLIACNLALQAVPRCQPAPHHPSQAPRRLRALLLPLAPLSLPLGFSLLLLSCFLRSLVGTSPRFPPSPHPGPAQLELLLPESRWRGRGRHGPSAPSRKKQLVLWQWQEAVVI